MKIKVSKQYSRDLDRGESNYKETVIDVSLVEDTDEPIFSTSIGMTWRGFTLEAAKAAAEAVIEDYLITQSAQTPEEEYEVEFVKGKLQKVVVAAKS